MVAPLAWLGRLNAQIYSVSATKLQKKIFFVMSVMRYLLSCFRDKGKNKRFGIF